MKGRGQWSKLSTRAAVQSAARLLTREQLDVVSPWQSSNPYVHSGFRHRSTFKAFTWSIFEMHNETMNIWSHLLGTVLFGYHWYHKLTTPRSDDSSIAPILVFLASATTCMGCSTLCHTYAALSPDYYRIMNQLDFFGNPKSKPSPKP